MPATGYNLGSNLAGRTWDPVRKTGLSNTLLVDSAKFRRLDNVVPVVVVVGCAPVPGHVSSDSLYSRVLGVDCVSSALSFLVDAKLPVPDPVMLVAVTPVDVPATRVTVVHVLVGATLTVTFTELPTLDIVAVGQVALGRTASFPDGL